MPFYSLRKGTPLPPSMLTIILSRFRTSIVFFLKNSDLIITFLLYLCSCYYFYLASFYIYFIVLNFIFYSSKVIDRQLRFKAHIFFLLLQFWSWHRVLGTRESDVRVINRGSLPQADLSTFRLGGLYLLNTFSGNAKQRTASGKHWCP